MKKDTIDTRCLFNDELRYQKVSLYNNNRVQECMLPDALCPYRLTANGRNYCNYFGAEE